MLVTVLLPGQALPWPAMSDDPGRAGLKVRALVTAGGAIQQDGLGLQERLQALEAALAADPGLLEPAEADGGVGLEPVVPDGAGPDLPGDLAGPLDVGGVDGGVQPVDR